MLVKHALTYTFMASLALGLGSTFAMNASAGPRSYADIQTASILSPGQSTMSRSIVIPYNKSTTVDLPGGMKDVIVSNPDIVDAIVHTAERVLLVGKTPGQTNVFFYGHNGQEILSLEIRVERDITGLKDLIFRHAPNSNVNVEAYNNNILLSGSVPDASTAKRVVELAKLWFGESAGGSAGTVTNLMSVEGNDQVQLKVRIVEMQRSVTKQMGINFNTRGQIGDANLGILSKPGVSAVSGLSSTLKWTNVAGGALKSLTAKLTALESVGLVRILAEPVLVAVSGATATFLSGGEFPLLTNAQLDKNGNVSNQFEFKPYGISLGFTPVVLSEGRISLNVSTEVSKPSTKGAISSPGGNILGLSVSRANTTVEMAAGSSMVIAGLISEESRQSSNGTPGLKDIPGIGGLFRSRDDKTTETELVIIVTPYLVNATHPDKLQTPLDGYISANDRDRALLGRLNKVYGKNKNPKNSTYKLNGPFGHVVD
ncbi:MAG: type II and III secretion system protein family protein [Robiginitomaculum sp.]